MQASGPNGEPLLASAPAMPAQPQHASPDLIRQSSAFATPGSKAARMPVAFRQHDDATATRMQSAAPEPAGQHTADGLNFILFPIFFPVHVNLMRKSRVKHCFR